jgi:hypothetical protein
MIDGMPTRKPAAQTKNLNACSCFLDLSMLLALNLILLAAEGRRNMGGDIRMTATVVSTY